MRHNLDGYQRQAHLLVLAHAAARELVAWAGGTIHPGESLMSVIDRRQVLASIACAVLLEGTARAVGRTISGALHNLRSAPLGALRRRVVGAGATPVPGSSSRTTKPLW